MANVLTKLAGKALGSNIDDFKGVFNKRQGPALQNRFMIFMTPPRGSLFNLDRDAAITGAIGALKNGFNAQSLLGFVNDPRDISFLCESCQIPGRTVLTVDHTTTKQAVKIPYSFLNEDVQFTFILTGDYYIKKMFDKWISMAFDTQNYELQYRDQYTTNVKIMQLNKDNIPIYTVKLENAFPTSITSIALDNNAESTIQKVTINMTYDNFVVEDLVSAAKGVVGQVTETAKGAIEQVRGVAGKFGF